jgi:hypothetical protein
MDTGGDDSFAAEEPAADGAVAFQRDALENRKIIQEAFLELTDDDTEGLFNRITTLVERSGGFVSSAELTRSGDEGRGPFVSMTVRVPAADMSSTLSAIEGLADEVTTKRIGSQDVTEAYADIEAQLRNLTILEEELLVILTEIREKSPPRKPMNSSMCSSASAKCATRSNPLKAVSVSMTTSSIWPRWTSHCFPSRPNHQ